MFITALIAKELGLSRVKELNPTVTINGVTTVELETAEGLFRVHLVRDDQDVIVKLEEGSKLAAYYNSLFWHEISTFEKIPIPSAHFNRSFVVTEDENKHSVYVTQFLKKGSVRTKLGLPELEQVASQIAKLHAVNSKTINKQFSLNVQENYGNIISFKKKIQKELIEVLETAVTTTEVADYFMNPSSVIEKVGILTHYLEDWKDEDADEKEKHNVIAHGRLTAEICRFDEDGNLVEITEWENIHLGNPVEDLANLIVSSADVDIRRKKFMKIFQVYFYALVDYYPPKYQLHDLKRWFQEYQPTVLINGIESLLFTLSEGSDDVKQDAARRWETALNDTVDFLTGNYISDNEHPFLSQKENDD
ncbi:CHK kinase-like domain-containing protein [Caenorhabditis elegans]|uniref:CHK kinase-like domain-containing protein n=1 Tax=Caenorhabditis elegans TaxID=6239 RepID=Q18739_CAEEL|nr:CHK kinase-like domain-containing protein [Caenorhabditis elegans]CAA94736.2 CHK kinase-like domain-containing protein [Caenorhabditis elegans]|eukprot:NP_505455.1 Uncharacterized protein CELE_C50F4.1 [Caenorhabditis elegans]